jgi:hypothetical protein
MRKLVNYQEQQIHSFKNDCEESAKQMLEIREQMDDKKKIR